MKNALFALFASFLALFDFLCVCESLSSFSAAVSKYFFCCTSLTPCTKAVGGGSFFLFWTIGGRHINLCVLPRWRFGPVFILYTCYKQFINIFLFFWQVS